MPDAMTVTTVLTFLFWSIVLGLGFAIGQWVWGVLSTKAKRQP